MDISNIVIYDYWFVYAKLSIGNNIKMISQINDKFGGRIMKEFVKPKMYQDVIWQIMSILEKNQKSQRRA